MYFKQCDEHNFLKEERGKSAIKYIVVHYTANDGDTARNNVDYYHREKLKNPASAHYFVDEREVACSVPWEFVAYHCGGQKYKGKNPSHYMLCRNFNSIGVEMCSRVDSGGGFYIKDETYKNAAEFVAGLMKTYNVKIDRVIRHYDVTGKQCPAPLVDARAWDNFKKLVLKYYNGEVAKVPTVYQSVDDIPAGEFRDCVSELVRDGIIKGDGNGLNLTYENVRMLVFLRRMIKKYA